MWADTLLTSVILTIVLGACGGGADGSTPPDGATTPSSPAGTETSPTPDGRTYSTQAGGGFSFSYPASWSEGAPATGLIQVIVQAPPEDADEGFVPNINLVIEPLRVDADTDTYFESSLHAVSSTFNGFELRAQGRITLGSRDARWLEYEWIAQGRRIRQRQVYTVSEDNGFVLTFSATPSAFEEHLGAQLLVESTFRFEA